MRCTAEQLPSNLYSSLRSRGLPVQIRTGALPEASEITSEPSEAAKSPSGKKSVSVRRLPHLQTSEPTSDPQFRTWFLARVREDALGCLVWVGSKNGRYGAIRCLGKSRQAHRVAWEMARGRIRRDRVLDHLCRNPLCVRAEHLEPVTQRVNLVRRDAARAALDILRSRRRHETPGALLDVQRLFRELPTLTRAAVLRESRGEVAP